MGKSHARCIPPLLPASTDPVSPPPWGHPMGEHTGRWVPAQPQHRMSPRQSSEGAAQGADLQVVPIGQDGRPPWHGYGAGWQPPWCCYGAAWQPPPARLWGRLAQRSRAAPPEPSSGHGETQQEELLLAPINNTVGAPKPHLGGHRHRGATRDPDTCAARTACHSCAPNRPQKGGQGAERGRTAPGSSLSPKERVASLMGPRWSWARAGGTEIPIHATAAGPAPRARPRLRCELRFPNGGGWGVFIELRIRAGSTSGCITTR